MTETEINVRRRAAERAKEVLAGTLSADAFREEFADVEDRQVAELIDLLEHEPERNGFLGGEEEAYRDYQRSVRDIITSLET